MYAVNNAPERARWQVCWVTDDGRVIRKDMGDDFHEAMRIYTMAVEGGRRAPVLRSKNMAFPPPVKWRPRYEDVLDVRGRPTGERIKHEPLEAANRAGQWWCPFCIKFRKFRHRKGWWTTEGVWMAEPSMVCPLCHIPHTAFDVKFWNPLARRITDSMLSAEGKQRRRRRRKAGLSTTNEED